MAEEKPSYLKAAFANLYNLSLLGGAVAASVLTGDYVVAAVALGAEALWLLFGPDFKPFQRAVDRAHREAREKAAQERIEKQMQALPQHDWARAHALRELRKEIERDMQNNPSFRAILIQTELDKLDHLHQSFVGLGTACARAESYLSAVNPKELGRQVEQQKAIIESSKDAAVAEIARKNIQVLERRQHTITDIQNFLSRARGQMMLIENTVRLLRDQVLTMASPDQLGEQLDDLITGVEAIQATARETESFMTGVELSPISPISSEEPEASRSGQRLRG
jgi:hypothetical protein